MIAELNMSRQVVIALKGAGNSGKTGALRKLYCQLLKLGAVCEVSQKTHTKNLRRYYLSYKRWHVVLCEGGDTDDIIHDNFDFANKACENLEGDRMRDMSWDVIVMPAWINMYARNHSSVQGCVGALMEEVWKNAYSLEIVDRNPVSKMESDKVKSLSQVECAKRVKRRIDFVLNDQFSI